MYHQELLHILFKGIEQYAKLCIKKRSGVKEHHYIYLSILKDFNLIIKFFLIVRD